MSSDLPRQILGWIIMAPSLIETGDLSANDFPVGQLRRTFEALSAYWENERPEEINTGILAERLGGNGAASYVSSLTIGLQKPSAEGFFRLVMELKKKALVTQVLIKIERQAKAGAFNLEEVRPDLVEYDRLDCPISSAKPLSSVEAKEINWLWSGRIPLGMLSLLAGNPGQGKSTLALAIAAKLSRGEPLPDSGGNVVDCDSLILAAEDPIAQVVRPRAELYGADLSRVFYIEVEELDSEEISGRLRKDLLQNQRIKYVVIDPLNAFLKDGTDYFRDPDIRRSLLRPLAILAEESGAAFLGIVHLNKKTDDSNPLNRIGGSVAYGAAARSVLVLGPDPSDKERRILALAKSNYSKLPGGIAFTIGEGGKVDFDSNPVPISADDLFQRHDENQAAEGDYAAEWLIGQLKDGPVNLKDLRRAAKKESISGSTLFRIRKRIGVITRVSGFGQFKVSTWELPK